MTMTLFKDVVNPTSFTYESGDSVIRTDTLSEDFSFIYTDCDNNVVMFKRSGAAYFGEYGGGNVYSQRIGADYYDECIHNVLAANGAGQQRIEFICFLMYR